ncbi:MAG: superoxide dismutase family protein [Actinobacteria bacterium]|nr:superoxide dismutase family protein [Actinomycetota bacterium]
MIRVIVIGAAATAAVAVFALTSGAGGSVSAASAVLVDAEGAPIGRVKVLSKGGKVQLSVDASRLSPGFHGFHVHGVGRCEAPFTSAGGHHNPVAAAHADHAGDLPVLLVARDGTANASFASDRLDVEGLLDADGSSIIVHAAPDNYANIPARYAAAGPDAATLATGDSGGRVACGVLNAGAGGEGSGRGR